MTFEGFLISVMNIKKKGLFAIALICYFSVTCFAQSINEIEVAYKDYYDKEYDSALYYFERITNKNPYHYDYRVKLAFTHFALDDFPQAIHSFKEAIEIGPWPDIYAYYIAASYVYMDSVEQAIDWLNKSVYKWKWPDYIRLEESRFFKPIQEHPEFRKIFGLDLVTDNRDQAWKNDLKFVYDKLKLLHYDLYNKTEATVWENRYQQVLSEIPEMDDGQIIMELLKFAALAGEGHTKVLSPREGDNMLNVLPLELYHFKEGTFIVNATEEYKDLIGTEVVSIGSKPIGELYTKSYDYRGHENMMHHKKMSPEFLVIGEALRDMNATKSLDKITVSLLKNGEKITEEIATVPEFEDKNWVVSQIDDQDHGIPQFYRNTEKDFWYEPIEESNAFYINIHYILNNDQTSFKNFCDSTFSVFDETKVSHLIIDLRKCGGGNSAYNKYLIEEILQRPEVNTEENLYVLIGRETYSAAINLVSDLEFRTNAFFIGEPIGSSPNFIGESNALKLPNSQMYLIISNRYHQGGENNSLDMRPWIASDITAEFMSTDFFQRKDPGMEFVLGQIKDN